jgi:hypothetical protein
LSTAAAKVVGSSAGVGAVAAQIKAVNPTATNAATISTVVSCEPGDLRRLIGLTKGGRLTPREYIENLRNKDYGFKKAVTGPATPSSKKAGAKANNKFFSTVGIKGGVPSSYSVWAMLIASADGPGGSDREATAKLSDEDSRSVS